MGMQNGPTVNGGGLLGARHQAVKLFGTKIPLPEEQSLAENGVVADMAPAPEPLNKEKDSSQEANTEDEQKSYTDIAKDAGSRKPEQEYEETETTGEHPLLIRPAKVLQCPRCDSMDTKFCYYNNYNVNQPRYFCKSCQRYWTSGGAMRNVPVGAGRRKNKQSTSSYCHTVQVDVPDQIHHEAPSCASNTSQQFSPGAPCDSTISVLNIEGPSCSSSVTATKLVENYFADDAGRKSLFGYQNGILPLHHLQCFPAPPWAYVWNPGWNNAVSMPWCKPSLVTAPTFCSPIPYAFVPASYWGCTQNWMGWGPWNLQLAGNNNGVPSLSSFTSAGNCLANGSPALGKHCRDAAGATSLGDAKPEKSLWVPKTLRIDDIDEAAKSSFFRILGINPDEDGVFKAFSSKMNKKGDAALHANPAALSRSQAFHETTQVLHE